MIVSLVPLGDYPVGTYSFGPVSVADDVTRIYLRIARRTTATPTIWPSASVAIRLDPEIEIDGVWRPYAGGQSVGGIVMAKNGGELTHDVIGGYVPPGINRRLRGSLTVTGGTLRSSADVELL